MRSTFTRARYSFAETGEPANTPCVGVELTYSTLPLTISVESCWRSRGLNPGTGVAEATATKRTIPIRRRDMGSRQLQKYRSCGLREDLSFLVSLQGRGGRTLTRFLLSSR